MEKCFEYYYGSYQLTQEPGKFTNKLLGTYSLQKTHTDISSLHIQSHNGTIYQNPAYKLNQLTLSENSSHLLFSAHLKHHTENVNSHNLFIIITLI
jgi:hypothetical protein